MTSRHDEVVDAAAGLHDLLDGYWRSQVLCTAARLGVADLLAGGPLTLPEMAVECEMPSSSLERLMRALVGLGVCTSGPEGYRTTTLGRALEAGAVGGAHERALVTAEVYYPLWGDLTDCLCREGSAVEIRADAGTPSPATEQVVVDLGEPEAKRVAATCELPERAVLVDVGGASDVLLAELLRAYPDCRGVLYELPGTVPGPRSSLTDAGLAARTDVAHGDVVLDVPAGGDLYLLTFVLHSYDDERAVALLRAVRRVMHPGAQLLVVEELLPVEEHDAAYASLHDLHMLVTTGGRGRTQAEHVALLDAAGLRCTGTVDTGGTGTVLRARPA